MLTVYLCDDEQEYLDQYTEMLVNISKKNDIEITISCFRNGEELLFFLTESTNKADIIYLDILLGNINGLEVSKKLRQLDCKSEIIFLTTSEDFVFSAYDVAPVQYLLKYKTSLTRFEEVFLRAVDRVIKKEKEVFICELGNIKKIIPINQISHFEIWKRLVTAHYNKKDTFEFYSTMELLDKQLAEKGFVRTHRSYIVNLTYISQFQQNNLVLKTGDIIPIGITYAKQVNEVFSQYIDNASVYY